MKLKTKRDKAAKHERITNDNVEEHRQRILAGGRRFKYPRQISKHKVLIITVSVAVGVVLLFAAWSWTMLYPRRASGDFFYSMTKILPLNVASVDGQPVRYSDYLRHFRASVYYMKNQESRDFSSADGQRQLEHIRRSDLTTAEQVALAEKIAGQKNLSVSDQQVDAEVAKSLKDSSGNSISLDSFQKSTLRPYYNWTTADYRQITRESLLLRQARFAVDTTAKTRADKIVSQLKSGADFASLAKADSDDAATKNNGGAVDEVGSNTLDSDGLIAAAKKLKIGQTSGVIQGSGAYYIIKLTAKTATTVSYSQIKINLTEFDKQFQNLQKSGKIKEFIKVNDQSSQS
jgi:hypothetical protein